MTDIEKILTKQIESANSLLERVMAIPDGKPSINLIGYINYDSSFTRPLSIDSDAWETETLEILRVLFGEDSRRIQDFENCIREKNTYFKFREDLQSELKHCVAYLKALITANNLKQKTIPFSDNNQERKKPLVFISHSSRDKAFAESLVNLLESLGFDSTNLFCSSIPDYWIGLSENIIDSLRSLFVDHELYVIFIQSPRYYESPICLNEMGAAWVLKTNYCSILTKDMHKEDMKGVVDSSTVFIKVDTHEAQARMNELKKNLTETFYLKPIPESTWERKRNTFLQSVNS